MPVSGFLFKIRIMSFNALLEKLKNLLNIGKLFAFLQYTTSTG